MPEQKIVITIDGEGGVTLSVNPARQEIFKKTNESIKAIAAN